MYMCHGTYRWKVFDEGYKFISDFNSIGGIYKKLWVSKVTKVLILGISGFPTWESWDKMTFGCRLHG
jgi:hypothetical protein